MEVTYETTRGKADVGAADGSHELAAPDEEMAVYAKVELDRGSGSSCGTKEVNVNGPAAGTKLTSGKLAYKVLVPGKKAGNGAKAVAGTVAVTGFAKKDTKKSAKKLKTVKLNTKVRKTVGSKAFKGIAKKASFKVPKASKKTYTKLLKKENPTKGYKVK